MADPQDAPIAIAAAADGTIWFTIDHADAIGRVRATVSSGCRRRGAISSRSGLAVAADGSAWYTDIAARGGGAHQQLRRDFALCARLRRLLGSDGWRSRPTAQPGSPTPPAIGITRLKDGVFTRHEIESPRGGPYGVAAGPTAPYGRRCRAATSCSASRPTEHQAIDLPRPGAVPTDVGGRRRRLGVVPAVSRQSHRAIEGRTSSRISRSRKENAGLSGLAVAGDGAVWFGMMRRASLGRLRDGRIEMFRLPRENARPYSLAVDREGNVWYADISGYVGMLPARHARIEL